MSIRNLEQEIKRRVKEALRGTQLTNTEGEFVEPLVETGALPKEVVKGTPYVLIQTTNIEDSDHISSADVAILYGTVGLGLEDSRNKEKVRYTHATGHWDVISIIDKIRIDFLKNVNFDFGILERAMKHEIFGEVNFPYFLGETRCKFTIPTTEPQDDYL